ncbi:MAG: hypothetical protein ACE5ID_09760, partial [Acidobacteriota bacterium]
MRRRFASLVPVAVAVSGWVLGGPFCPPPDPANLARGAAYTFKPAANYHHPNPAIDNQAGDATDLTDGCFVNASHAAPESVTWNRWPRVRVDIDLAAPGCAADAAACRAISEIRFQVQDRKGAAGIFCPTEAAFLVSDDGIAFHQVAVWVRPAAYPAVDCGAPGPQFNGTNFWISSGSLATRGAFARVEITADGNFIFMDEVEVLAGSDPTQTGYLQVSDFDAKLDAFGPVWRVFHENPWDVVGPESLPAPSAPDSAGIIFNLAGDETGSAALLVTNPHVAGLEITAAVTDLTGPAGATLPASSVDVRHAAEAETLLFTERADALFPMAGEAAVAAPRSLTHLWVDVHVPPGARPGGYFGSLTLRCAGTSCDGDLLLPVSVQVQPFTLPPLTDLRASFFDWSYSVPEASPFITGALAPERAAIRRWADTNTDLTYLTPLPSWSAAVPTAPDFIPLAAALDRYPFAREHVLYLAGGSGGRRNFQGHVCYPSPAWDAAYSFWIAQIRDFMLARGVGYEGFMLYLVDEPSTTRMLTAASGCPAPARSRLQFYEDAALLVKGVDPALRLFINSGETDTAALQNLADQGLVQVWVPHHDTYFAHPSLMAFYAARQAAGERIMLYNGPGVSLDHKHPYSDERLLPWTIFQNGLDGYGYWALFSPARAVGSAQMESLWRPLDGQSVPYGAVYLNGTWDAATPPGLAVGEDLVPSRRLAGLRQGIEDYRSLVLLDDLLLQSAGLPGCASENAAAAATLISAPGMVLGDPSDTTAADTLRTQVVSSIKMLKTGEVLDVNLAPSP